MTIIDIGCQIISAEKCFLCTMKNHRIQIVILYTFITITHPLVHLFSIRRFIFRYYQLFFHKSKIFLFNRYAHVSLYKTTPKPVCNEHLFITDIFLWSSDCPLYTGYTVLANDKLKQLDTIRGIRQISSSY